MSNMKALNDLLCVKLWQPSYLKFDTRARNTLFHYLQHDITLNYLTVTELSLSVPASLLLLLLLYPYLHK